MKRFVIVFVAFALLLAGCRDKEASVHKARILAFGTLIDVSIADEKESRAEQATESLEQLFQSMHKRWHAWDPGPLKHTNQLLSEGRPFTAPEQILPLLKLSIPLAEKSEHLFNPAVGKLIDAWGFQGKKTECHTLPNSEQILPLVQQAPKLSDLTVDGTQITNRNPAVKLDFGAVGKGYGIDLAIARLHQLGIKNALINAGGDLRAIGNRSGRPWRIAIRHPDGGMLGILRVTGDESVFTSGNYERKYSCDNKLYHHIIDPRTGYPARGTRSVTVIHNNAATADAAATALFIAGPEDWHRIAGRMNIRYVALLDEKGVLHVTRAMHKRLQLVGDNNKIKVSPPLPQR